MEISIAWAAFAAALTLLVGFCFGVWFGLSVRERVVSPPSARASTSTAKNPPRRVKTA